MSTKHISNHKLFTAGEVLTEKDANEFFDKSKIFPPSSEHIDKAKRFVPSLKQERHTEEVKEEHEEQKTTKQEAEYLFTSKPRKFSPSAAMQEAQTEPKQENEVSGAHIDFEAYARQSNTRQPVQHLESPTDVVQ